MKIANVKSVVAKLMMVGLAAGAFALASPAKAQAQRFAVGVQFGNPDYRYYANGYRHDRDDYRYDRDDYRHDRDHDRQDDFSRRERRDEFREREENAELARRQAYLRHEEWEREHRYYSSYGDQ